MVDRSRINLVVEILKKEGRLPKNELIRQLEKKGPMARQTASNAIDIAVESQRIFRQDDVIGKKQHIVLLDITPEIAIWENHLYDLIRKNVDKLYTRFSIFKDKFSSLSIEEKSEGVYVFSYLMNHIAVLVELVELGWRKTEKWSNLKIEIIKKGEEFVKLSTSLTKEEQVPITLYMLSQRFLDVKDDFEEVEDFLKEIKEK